MERIKRGTKGNGERILRSGSERRIVFLSPIGNWDRAQFPTENKVIFPHCPKRDTGGFGDGTRLMTVVPFSSFLSFFLKIGIRPELMDATSSSTFGERRESENGGFFLERRRRRIETPPPIRVGSLSLFCFLGGGLRSYSFSIRANARGEDSPPPLFFSFDLGQLCQGRPHRRRRSSQQESLATAGREVRVAVAMPSCVIATPSSFPFSFPFLPRSILFLGLIPDPTLQYERGMWIGGRGGEVRG